MYLFFTSNRTRDSAPCNRPFSNKQEIEKRPNSTDGSLAQIQQAGSFRAILEYLESVEKSSGAEKPTPKGKSKERLA